MFQNTYTNVAEENLDYANLSKQRLHATSNKGKKLYR